MQNFTQNIKTELDNNVNFYLLSKLLSTFLQRPGYGIFNSKSFRRIALMIPKSYGRCTIQRIFVNTQFQTLLVLWWLIFAEVLKIFCVVRSQFRYN